MGAVIRKSVPINDREREFVERLRTPGSPERDALSVVAGVDLSGEVSEAEILHALVSVGRDAVAEQVLEDGYRALAASENEEDRALHRAMRDRAVRVAERS